MAQGWEGSDVYAELYQCSLAVAEAHKKIADLEALRRADQKGFEKAVDLALCVLGHANALVDRPCARKIVCVD